MPTRRGSPLEDVAFLYALLNLYVAVCAEGQGLFESTALYVGLTLMVTGAYFWVVVLASRPGEAGVQGWDPGSYIQAASVFLVAAASLLLYFSGPRAFLLLGTMVALLCASLLWLRAKGTRAGAILWLIQLAVAGVFVVFSLIQIHRVEFGHQSDMLVLVEKALSTMVGLEDPYQSYRMSLSSGRSYDLPLTYLPLTWLPYLPAYLTGMDLRYVNVAAGLASQFIVFRFIRERLLPSSPAAAILGSAMAASYFLNGYFLNRLDSEIHVLSFWVTLFFLSVHRGKWISLGLALGATLAASPLGWLLFPFVLLHTYKTDGIRRAVWLLSISGALTALLVLPFVIWSPAAFFQGVVGHWSMLNGYSYEWAKASIRNISLGLFFYQLQAQSFLKYVQILLSVAIVAVFWKTGRAVRAQGMLAFCALEQFVFLLSNVVVWTYLYQPGLLLLLGAMLLSVEEQVRQGSARGTASAG